MSHPTEPDPEVFTLDHLFLGEPDLEDPAPLDPPVALDDLPQAGPSLPGAV